METIFALATAAGRAGVAVVRMSGPEALAVGEAICGQSLKPRVAQYGRLSARDGTLIDTGLVLAFAGPASFTGEDVVEFQVHGSRAVIDMLLLELGKYPNCRIAEPGEFTRRALRNSKMDLTQVEGLADLIEAETTDQLRLAQRVAGGELSSFVTELRRDLVRAAALLEAMIDFADEDVPDDVSDEVADLVQRSIAALHQETEGQPFAERLREGFEVAIVGPTNAGKSTLLNRIAGRDAAITSEVAGTTRDIVEVRMALEGLPVTFLDTAGLRMSEDPIEAEGMRRARDRARKADLRVFLSADEGMIAELRQTDDLFVAGKADLAQATGFGISGKTGEGVDEMLRQVVDILRARVSRIGISTHRRHVTAYEEAVFLLERAAAAVETGPLSHDVAAEDIRLAVCRLDSILGRVDVEDLLDVIFSSFCLGK